METCVTKPLQVAGFTTEDQARPFKSNSCTETAGYTAVAAWQIKSVIQNSAITAAGRSRKLGLSWEPTTSTPRRVPQPQIDSVPDRQCPRSTCWSTRSDKPTGRQAAMHILLFTIGLALAVWAAVVVHHGSVFLSMSLFMLALVCFPAEFLSADVGGLTLTLTA